MLEVVLAIAAILVCQAMQALDDLMSQFGVVSVLHGMVLGYGQVYVANALLGWGGVSLGWVLVVLIALCALAISIYKIHNTGTRWIFAFNLGILCGILYGGIDLV